MPSLHDRRQFLIDSAAGWSSCLLRPLAAEPPRRPHAAQHFFRERRAPYPVERTLLASGVLDAAMWSRELEGRRINTPNLEWCYAAQDFSAMRETGASWKVLTCDTLEVKAFEPGDAALFKASSLSK